MEVKMEGYAFTSTHPSATKMSLSSLMKFILTSGLFLFGFNILGLIVWGLMLWWNMESNITQAETKNTILKDLVEIDKNLDEGANSDELLPARTDLNRKLYEINQMDLKDVAQKAKIRWAIEVTDAKFVADFRPINLIGSVYKVVTKILANRLAMVNLDLVSNTQSAFVASRQILGGPFILNEVLSWCKRKRKEALVFKVDFAKAYDSVHWDFLLNVLSAFGFGSKWCHWIRGIFSSNMASVLVNGSPTIEFPIIVV
nr:RNA-directed DNA polymerase, eukaryota [Tanacetum cinerariifolium]